jgi:hypothetical protein
MDDTSKDQKSLPCHFWDPTAEAGRNPNSKCQGKASGFIRKAHDKRLCPLCDTCKETFVRATKEMDEKVREGTPGGGTFEEVALSPASLKEFSDQPAKKSA